MMDGYTQLSDNMWRNDETGLILAGRNGQSLESLLEETAAMLPEAQPVASTFKPLSPYQFRAMIAIAGVEQKIDDAVTAMTDPVQKAVARAKLDYALLFHRDDPLIAALAPTVNLTSAQIDDLWQQAENL